MTGVAGGLAVGSQDIQPVGATEVEQAVAVHEAGTAVVLEVEEAVGAVQCLHHAGVGVVHADAVIGAQPEAAAGIGVDAINHVVGQAVARGDRAGVAGLAVEPDQTA